MESGSVEKKIQCKGCKKGFSTFSSRSKHYKTCVKVDDQVDDSKPKEYEKVSSGRFSCNHCKKTVAQLCNMYRHILTHHRKPKQKVKEKKVFSCVVCSKTFHKQSKLIRHESLHNRKYDCVTCNRSFKRNDFFEAHIQVCNDLFADNMADNTADAANKEYLCNGTEEYSVAGMSSLEEHPPPP